MKPLPFSGPFLLAPMEGVTEPCFRELVARRNCPATLGGLFTEFVRVSREPVSSLVLERHLGARSLAQPTGLQLLGANLDAMAESARRAEAAGAALVDINLGCPARRALRGRAGAAFLDDPAGVERLVAAVAGAVEKVPVSAKMRAGGDDDSRLEELAQAVEAGGADLLVVHCRTRAEKYTGNGDWTRLVRAVAAVSIPVAGNGGVNEHADFERLRAETGCAYAMAGRAALGDPWIFSGRSVTPAEAAEFLLEYADEMVRIRTMSLMGAAGRVKQLLQHWRAGGLVDEGGDSGRTRRSWLAEKNPEHLFTRLRALRDGP